MAVLLSVALLGGALPAAVVASSVLGSASLLLVEIDRSAKLSLPPLALLPLVAGTACLLQLLPLPTVLLARLGPASEELRRFALIPLGLTRSRPVTLDAPATWLQVAQALGFAATLTAAAELARSRRSRRTLAAAVGLAGLAVALVGYGHQLDNAHALFGVHTFQNRELAFLTPFGNRNHLAAFLTLSTLLLLGLAAEATSRQGTALWVGLAAVTGPGAFFSLSRGGIFFFITGLLALVVTLVFGRVPLGKRDDYRPGSDDERHRRPLAVAAGALGLLALAAYLALDRLSIELTTLDSVEKFRQSKLELWPMFGRAALQVWPFGLGRGAFSVGFARWQTQGAFLNFTHPENWVLQWAAEFGLPLSLGLLALSVWAALRTVRGDASALERAAACGLLALVLHDLFDFALELEACATAAAVAAGVLSGRSLAQGRGFRLGRRTSSALVGATIFLVAVGLWRGSGRAEEAAESLGRLVADGLDTELLRAQALTSIDAHPAEASLYRTVGFAEIRSRPHDALAFLARALWLRPLDSESHRATALVMMRLGAPAQAMGEWRLARDTSTDPGAVLTEALHYATKPELLTILVGPNLADAVVLASLLWNSGRHNDAEALLAWGRAQAETAPGFAALWTSAASFSLAAGKPADALLLLDEAERRGDEVTLLRAQVLTALGRPRDAVETLEAALVRRPEDAGLSFALAKQWLALGQPSLARQTLERLEPFVGDTGARASLLATEAETYRAEGRLRRALESIERATSFAPNDASLYYQAAQLNEQLGRLDAASRAVRNGARLEGPAGAARAQEWLKRLEKASQTEQLRTVAAQSPLQKLVDDENRSQTDAGTESQER